MEITAEQMIEVLNQRAQNEPYIKEVLRATMYEAVLRIQAEQAETPDLQAVPPVDENADESG